MKETVAIFVDYESPPAHRVARDIWSAFSRIALNAGLVDITARWKGLLEKNELPDYENASDASVCLFVIGQDRPEMAESVRALGNSRTSRLYGVVVATPERPSPLSGPLLYQGVGRLIGDGAKAGAVMPALVPVYPKTECEAYATRLFERLQEIRARH